MKAKRFLSVLMAVMLLVSCFAISASAANANDSNVKPGGPYTLNIKLLSTADSGNQNTDTNVTGKENAAATGDPISGYKFSVYSVSATSTSTDISQTGANNVQDLTATNTNGLATFTTSTAGRYLVVPTPSADQPSSVTGTPVSFLVDLPMTDPENLNSWLTTVYAYPKTLMDLGTPTISKTVSDGTVTKGNGEGVSIGGTNEAIWKVTATFPNAISDYSTYTIKDTIDNRLTYVTGSVSAKYYDSTGNEITDTASLPTTAPTYVTNDKKIQLWYTTDDIAKLPAGGKVEITFKTTINTGSECVKIPNRATLDYQNKQSASSTAIHSGSSGDTADPTTDPYVWTGKLDFVKVDAANDNTKLSGAEFTLYKADSTSSTTLKLANSSTVNVTEIDTATSVASTGAFGFNKLAAGTYYLVETKAPSGYNLIGVPITITIDEANMNGTGTAIDNVFALPTTGNTFTVKDIAKTDLPLTGGTGVLLFVAAGIALLGVGAVVFFKKDKKAKA